MLKIQTRNREMCKKCIYHGGRLSEKVAIFCDYSGKSGTTCLYLRKNKVVDRRGNDPNNCRLFDDGKKKVKHPYRKLFTKCEREVNADDDT